MTVRKNSRRTVSAIDNVIENLPERFYAPKIVVADSANNDLRYYMWDLANHLRQELSVPDGELQSLTVEVMRAIGISVADWYRIKLTAPGSAS